MSSMNFWQRDDIAALICVRGGYGSNYLLDKLDYDMFAARPKVLLGCSDITHLLTAITIAPGWLPFMGRWSPRTLLMGPSMQSSWSNALAGAANWSVPAAGVEVLRPGKAHGRLYGGCLSMLVASLGTPFEIQTEGTILFIEDIAEKPYRIDRMLMAVAAGRQTG